MAGAGDSGPVEWISQWIWKREALPDRDRFRRPYRYPFGDKERPEELVIKQRPFGPEGFASTVWDSSIVLSKYLEKRGASALSGRRVVELGAGCGLVTVVCSRLGADCVATDLADNLPLLDENCSSNATAARGGACPRVLPLRWGRAETEAFLRGERGGFDIVVGTDLMYVNEAVVALVETLDVLSSPGPGEEGSRRRPAEVLLAYGRNRWAEGAFMEAAKEVFSIEDVPASELDELYQCPDVTVLRLTKLQQPRGKA